MNLLRTQYDRIQAQLLALSASQKMLTAALVAIMVMTLFYWVHYAASPEYSPVLDQSLSSEDAGQVASFLRDRNYDVKVVGDRVEVPSDKQMQAVAELTYAQKMPQNMADGFDTIIKQMNPFDPPDKTDEMWKHATEITVGGVIERWDGVASASVMIDKTMKRGLSLDDTIEPTAGVNIIMRDGVKPSKHLAQAASRFLTGSVAGLDPSRVHVIINGIPFNTTDSDDLSSASNAFDEQREQEEYYSEQIEKALGYMNSPIFASVHVQVDSQSTSTESIAVDPKNSLYKPIKEETTSDETNNAASSAPEPGVGANVQASIGESAGGKTGSTKSEETNEYTLVPSQTTTRSVQAAGKAIPTAATVQIPRTYFIACCQKENAAVKDPDANTIQAMVDKQLPFIKGAIRGCTGLNDEAISVGLYDPVTPESAGGTVATVSAPQSAVSQTLNSHGKDIAVVVLALVSLFMVSMMVRKGAPQPIISVPEPTPEPQSLDSSEQVAGEATEGNPLLDGMEIDDDAIKTQQMIGQVSQMVKENPDGAANLVKRWLNRV